MGTDNPNENQTNYDNLKFRSQQSGDIGEQNQKRVFRERLYSDPQQVPNEDELLQPIRRHSVVAKNNCQNRLSSKGLNQTNAMHNSIGIPSQNNQNKNGELPTLFERSKNRKLSQQYCADFKKVIWKEILKILF